MPPLPDVVTPEVPPAEALECPEPPKGALVDDLLPVVPPLVAACPVFEAELEVVPPPPDPPPFARDSVSSLLHPVLTSTSATIVLVRCLRIASKPRIISSTSR